MVSDVPCLYVHSSYLRNCPPKLDPFLIMSYAIIEKVYSLAAVGCNICQRSKNPVCHTIYPTRSMHPTLRCQQKNIARFRNIVEITHHQNGYKQIIGQELHQELDDGKKSWTPWLSPVVGETDQGLGFGWEWAVCCHLNKPCLDLNVCNLDGGL